MNINYNFRILLVVCFALLGGCRSAPIYNVEQAPIVAPQKAGLDDIKQALVRGARKAGWIAKPVSTGKILATYSYKRGRYKAIVDIDYDMDSYDIRYRGSSNLKYRETEPKTAGSEGGNVFSEYNPFENADLNPFDKEQPEIESNATIHKSYNEWVRKLEEKINLELAALPLTVGKTPSVTSQPVVQKQTWTTTPVIQRCDDAVDTNLSGQAVVRKNHANLRSGIGTKCAIVGGLEQGDVVNLLGEKGKWYYIATGQGLNAWVYAPLLTRVAVEATQPEEKSEPASPSQRISIAVIQFKTLNKEAQDIALGDLVSETFTSALVNSSIFKITEREQLDKVIKEMEMNQTGFIETTDAVEIGKMLHADAIITGSVALLGNQIQLNARAIDIESAYVISAETKTSTYSLSNINKMVNEIVASLAQRFQKN